MKFTLIKSIYSNEILPQNRFDMPWERFCKILTVPQVVENKEDVQLISPVEYYSEEDALDFTDSGKVRRCSDNVKSWEALPIDLDGQISINDAKEYFKDYEYILYTTFNHQSEKKNFVDCFRIFIKITEPVLNEDFVCRRASLQKFIGLHDRSTLATSRGFFLPSCKNAADAVFYHNQGIALDVKSLPPTIEIPYVPTTDREPPSEALKAKVLEQLFRLREVDYTDWWKICSAMINTGYSLNEFEQLSRVIRSHRPKNNCKGQWGSSKRKHIEFGFLINLLVENFGSSCLQIPKDQPQSFILAEQYNKLSNYKHKVDNS